MRAHSSGFSLPILAFRASIAVMVGLAGWPPAPVLAQQEGSPFGVQAGDVYTFLAVADVQLSPDGRTVAYTVQQRDRPGRPYTQVWLQDVASGARRSLTPSGMPASSPRWSPDGRWIAFSGSDGERSGLMVVAADGSEVRFLTAVRGTNHPLPSTGESMAWSPSSDQIAFVSATPGPEPEEAGAGGDPIVIRRYLYRTTGGDGVSYFNDNRRLNIFSVDLHTQAVRQLTEGDRYNHSIDWSPNGRGTPSQSQHSWWTLPSGVSPGITGIFSPGHPLDPEL